jgi:hypothetical protein
MELKKLNAKIVALGKKTSKWRDEVQETLVGCAWQAFNGDNVDPCTKLVKVLGGADARAIIKWIESHMPARWVKSENQFRVNKSFKGEYDALVLLAAPWWELATKTHNIDSSLDCLDAVRNLIKRIESEIKSGKKTVEHVEVLAELKAVAGKVEQASM